MSRANRRRGGGGSMAPCDGVAIVRRFSLAHLSGGSRVYILCAIQSSDISQVFAGRSPGSRDSASGTTARFPGR